MHSLTALIQTMPEYRKLRQAVLSGSRALSFYGLSPVHRATFAAALLQELERPICLIARDESSAKALLADIEALIGEHGSFLPSRDMTFHNIYGMSREYEHARIAALHSFRSGSSRFMTASADAMMLRTMPPEVMERACISLNGNGTYDLSELAVRLLDAGYTRTEQVEGPGQFALRGGILDVFPAGAEAPLRAEFWGDEIDSLGVFDAMTQRRSSNLREALILPAREILPSLGEGGADGLCERLRAAAGGKGVSAQLLETINGDVERISQSRDLPAADKYASLIYPEFSSAFDHLPPDTLLICSDSGGVGECARGFAERQSEQTVSLLENALLPPVKSGFGLSAEELDAHLGSRQTLYFDTFLSAGTHPDAILSLDAKQLPSFGGNTENALRDLTNYIEMGYTVLAFAGGQARAKNLSLLLEENGLPCSAEPAASRITVLPDNLSAGFEYPSIRLAVVCEGEPPRRAARRASSAEKKNRIRDFSDLSPGDLVVHESHGIGRFVGVERIQVDKIWRDYIKIAFAGTDFVFVPATALNLISKYIGSGGDNASVRLSKLGGSTWAKTRQRAKHSAQELARELLRLYAARRSTPGFAFPEDDDWQRSFEESFPYDETEAQLVCAQEIKHDMQQPYPMDRLLCGDVGFGKTEVAFRAVMKCLLAGKQAAILVPTTVLARQHYVTACERFSSQAVRIEMLSRYRTPAQARETLRRVKNGQCDLLIGTHRILQKDVEFGRLGLLIVDEEQRFGVTHKERIKQMSAAIDVLTLTATPIPRTLNMALSGIRDMSVLEDAPLGRQPVQTYVLEHSDAVLRDAMRRELSRGGQVYYLHNHIDSIERTAARIQQDFPEAVVAVGHGRMSEEELGGVMSKMYAGEISILVCTTIIETGIDIPNVNTLIIEDADHMGLAQLHQIRGRVGRSARRAYAYFTYRRGKVLSEIAQKRLSAIREFAEFGSGFKIAMRDLEIRGAGNVLGAEQSGHMMNVGYDMYLRLLEEAAGELKGERPAASARNCLADLNVSANIPQSYMADAGQRVEFYRRIALISSHEDYGDMLDELCDRFGEPPASVVALLDIALMRADASAVGIYEINQKGGSVLFYFHRDSLEASMAACAAPAFKGRVLLNAGEKPYISLRLRPGEDPLAQSASFIKLYNGAAS
ncbi:MAG: transcription-repair coupling factor [Clostridia bacterium]|nr:transcription-repair coupling factor [Clostridia bacterium]